jgi:hypothetical protein
MTWAEAKAKSGIPTTSKQKEAGRIKAENHGKLLAAKILAKAGPTMEEQIHNRQAAKQARKDQHRQAQLEAQREAEKERQRLEAVARPHERAQDKLRELVESFASSSSLTTTSTTTTRDQASSPNDDDDLADAADPSVICESKQLQLDELLALHAIYADTPDVLTVAEDSQWDDLPIKLEQWQDDPTSVESQDAVVRHPPIRLALKRSIADPEDDDWVAHCLVEITMPPTYPLVETPPKIQVTWFLLTQKSLIVADNKPFESLGTLDEVGLLQAVKEQAQELIGMPCLYEVMDTWFSENLFQFISVSPTTLPC